MVSDAVLPPATLHPAAPEVATRPRGRTSARSAAWAAALVLAPVLALRIVYACVYRVDSDEPQHLHVVWAWTRGLIPYRDLFDNHSPLFQMLCSPVMALLGEHAWIVVPMRLAMLPLYALDVWFIYLIGRALYVERWAVWMAIVSTCVPAFFLVTTEFRTDDLWTTLWLALVWQAVAAPLAGRRALIFGLTLGACFSVSMKTSLLLASMGVAFAGVLGLQILSRRKPDVPAMLKSGGLILCGTVVVPCLLIAFFAAHGALHQMYYCIITHNAFPGLGKWNKAGFHLWKFPLSLPALVGLGWVCMHSSAKPEIGAGRALVAMTAVAYYFLLRSYWPLVTAQDFTPILPLAAFTLLALLFHTLSLTKWPERIAIPIFGLLLLGIEAGVICKTQSPFDNEALPFQQDLAAVLRITNPSDLVMDGKGETIFRRRPIYWALEGITLRRIQLGLIVDDFKQRMIDSRTCVALRHRLPQADSDWLRANFIAGGGKVWVAGQNLGPARPVIRFHTDINTHYSFVSDKANLAGRIDGKPILNSQAIAPGDHRLEITGGHGNIALVWTQALQRGFNPFDGKSLEVIQ